MSKQVTSNRYSDASRRNPMTLGKFGHANVVPILESRARATPEGLGDVAEQPLWPRRRRQHAREELNNQAVTVLAHELRNSLCVIRMATGILTLELSGSPAGGKARALIAHQTAHMSRLVEDLLETSRGNSVDLALKCEKVNLCAVAEHALQSVEATMQLRRHSLSVSIPVAALWLHGDPARLEQVLVNLLLNAAKYTLPGGVIQVSVECAAGEAVVRIADNGIGIAADVLPRVFDLFVQADPSSCHTGAGLGIGLALVRNLIERHGGRVTAESLGLGCGSEFVVRLPTRNRRDQ